MPLQCRMPRREPLPDFDNGLLVIDPQREIPEEEAASHRDRRRCARQRDPYRIQHRLTWTRRQDRSRPREIPRAALPELVAASA